MQLFDSLYSYQFGQVHTVIPKLIPNIESPDISRLNKRNVAMDPFTKFNQRNKSKEKILQTDWSRVFWSHNPK